MAQWLNGVNVAIRQFDNSAMNARECEECGNVCLISGERSSKQDFLLTTNDLRLS